jgi:large subunit ribosomal protein L13
MQKNPSKALYGAVKGMLPKSTLGKMMLRSLKIYPEAEHSHTAQNPQTIEV